MRQFKLSHLSAALASILFLLTASSAIGEEPSPQSPDAANPKSKIQNPKSLSVNLLDAAGNVRSIQPISAAPARVFVFLTGECPISKGYIPELNRLWDEWSKQADAVELYGVWADATTTAADVLKFADEHEIHFPLLVDRDGELAREFGPTHVPEAFVLDADGHVAYRGRIDDAYPDLGRRREPTEHNLADAVAATIEGKPVAESQTTPVGCLFETLPAAADKRAVTYTRDIAPILFANCAACHCEGGVGPFALANYQDAAKRARQISLVVGKRLMPPWMPTETHGEFIGQRTLTERQIELVKTWAEGERAEGDLADLPALPPTASGWPLGEPDMILQMQEDFEVRADGRDVFQNFVIPIDVPTDKLVAAVDFRPGNPRVVHHSLLYLDSNRKARALDAATPEPGYSSFGGPGFLPTGSIGGWSPGKTPRRLSGGLGRYLKQGSDLVMQIHYHPNGKREIDRSKVGVYFVDQPKNIAADIWLASYHFDIPPGEKDYRLAATYTLPQDVTLLGVIPHMHLIGHSMTATATFPDGATRKLIDVPNWNFNWQDDYRFARPFKLPKGTRLDVAASYDNSAENPANPNSPPQRIAWGEGTGNEMFYCFFLVAADDPQDLKPLLTEILIREATGRAAAKFGKK